MKKYILQIATVILLAVLLISTDVCKKLEDFGDTNLNPNGVPDPILSALLTNAGINVVGTVTTQAPSMFCQYLAESTYPGISKYTGLQIDAQGTYSGILQDCQVIINKNNEPDFKAKAAAYGDNNSQIAIATILRSYIMWTMTDRWGDLPYSEALQGAGNLLPKYDEQKDIYKGLIEAITLSNDLFNPNGVTVKGDILYGGDVSKWRKFGNSLKMLIAVRMSKRYPNAGEYAATTFNNALNSPYGYITDNADNFGLQYKSGFYQNPYFALHTSQDIAVSLTFTDALNGMGDTRELSMASITNGCPYGLAAAAPLAIPYARTFNSTFSAEGAFVTIISAGSVLLAKAEAIERGWVPGTTTADAKIAYDAGVAASFAQWSQTMPATYLTTGVANYATGPGGGSIGGTSVAGSSAATVSKLERIALQQWYAFYPAGIQGWSNWRRTGIPVLKPTIFHTNTDGEIPRRYTYGVQDATNNKAQMLIAIARYPLGDVQNQKIWWDQ